MLCRVEKDCFQLTNNNNNLKVKVFGISAQKIACLNDISNDKSRLKMPDLGVYDNILFIYSFNMLVSNKNPEFVYANIVLAYTYLWIIEFIF